MDVPSSARVTAGLIGLWTFDENGGALVGESSGLVPAIDLTIADVSKVVWSPGSLTVAAPVIINSGFARNRLLEACAASDGVTFEIWATPADVTQTGTVVGQPARAASFAPANGGNHHISVGQNVSVWVGEARTTNGAVNANGGPGITSGPIVGSVTHVVVEASPSGRKLYVNGMVTSDTLGGPLDWDPMRTLSLSGEPNGKNPWLGSYHLMAMYDRVLSDAEIMQNFVAGP